MKIIIAGSRDINDYQLLRQTVFEFAKAIHGDNIPIPLNSWIDEIISGGARGVDAMGERFAEEQGIDLVIFKANWKKYNKSAGPIRNSAMASYVTQTYDSMSGLIAIPNIDSFVSRKGGTMHMIKCATDRDFDYVFVKTPNGFSMEYTSTRV